MQIPSGKEFLKVKSALDKFDLRTVCQEARCPNRGECWGQGTATFMVLGDICTRSCLFCSVRHASEGQRPQRPDPDEPKRILEAVRLLELRHVVITSVSRDDLDDGGSRHIAAVIETLAGNLPSVRVEALIPDIQPPHLSTVVRSPLYILAHNIEVVKRLTPRVRDKRARYETSLAVLREAKGLKPDLMTKSSLILGLGESREEVIEAMEDLRDCGVDLLTLGQYLQPTESNIPVQHYLPPRQWDTLRSMGEAMGFKKVFSGPLVRSSYLAGEMA